MPTSRSSASDGIILETDADTHYWRDGEPAAFSDIKVGDKLRTKTHGVGKGKTRRCWEVFLDDASLTKFQNEQKEVHRERMIAEGLPGYVDEVAAEHLQLTLFCEGGNFSASSSRAPKSASLRPGSIASRRPSRSRRWSRRPSPPAAVWASR